MTKTERSLILFLETQAVDYFGKVGTAHMNDEDMEIAKRWDGEGYITFKRLPADEVFGENGGANTARRVTHRVSLSEEAWKDAHAERRARYERNAPKA